MVVAVLGVALIRARGEVFRPSASDAGADDFLTKPFDRGELRARVRSLARPKRYTDELDSAESVIRSLALTIEARDECTEGHCQRLARYAAALGAAIGARLDVQSALEKAATCTMSEKSAFPMRYRSSLGRCLPPRWRP